MNRFRRWIFNPLAALSLMLCLALAALWVRGYWFVDIISFCRQPGISYIVYCQSGRIQMTRSVLTGRTSNSFSDGADAGPGYSRESYRRFMPAVLPFTAKGSPPWVQWIGFDYLTDYQSRPYFGTLVFHRIIIPIWLLVLMTALPLIPLARGIRKNRRKRQGRCLLCGYDLRATPKRCPECGVEA